MRPEAMGPAGWQVLHCLSPRDTACLILLTAAKHPRSRSYQPTLERRRHMVSGKECTWKLTRAGCSTKIPATITGLWGWHHKMERKQVMKQDGSASRSSIII